MSHKKMPNSCNFWSAIIQFVVVISKFHLQNICSSYLTELVFHILCLMLLNRKFFHWNYRCHVCPFVPSQVLHSVVLVNLESIIVGAFGHATHFQDAQNKLEHWKHIMGIIDFLFWLKNIILILFFQKKSCTNLLDVMFADMMCIVY